MDDNERARQQIIRIMEQHKGKANAIVKDRFLYDLGMTGVFFEDERVFRDVIHDLRQEGHLILSGSTGYYMASSRSEFDEFAERELLSRIKDLAKTISKMRASATIQFGKQRQLI